MRKGVCVCVCVCVFSRDERKDKSQSEMDYFENSSGVKGRYFPPWLVWLSSLSGGL